MTEKPTPSSQVIILIIGDLLVLLSFVAIGRRNHSMSVADIGATFMTALPFVISWFVVTPWFGIYKAQIYRVWQRLVPRLLLAWAVAGPLALVLRALFLGRSVPTGIMPTFALVSIAYIGIVALIWRLAFMWWTNRKQTSTAEVAPR